MKKILGILMLFVVLCAGVYAKAPELHITFCGEEVTLSSAPILHKGKIYVYAKDFQNIFNYTLRYDKKNNTVEFCRDNGWVVGNYLATSGKEGDDGYNPINVKGKTYIPLETLVGNFDYEYNWDAKTSTLTLNHLINVVDGDTYEPSGFKYDTSSGNLYKGEQLIAKIPFDNKYVRKGEVSIKEMTTANGSKIYEVSDCYGEPHINFQVSVIYSNLKETVVGSTKFHNDFGSLYFVKDHKVGIVDGNKLTVFDDQTGEIINSYVLGEENKGYAIEALEEDFVLFRKEGEWKLTLQDFAPGKQLTVYEKILKQEQIAQVKMEDIILNDGIKYEGRKGDTLYFSYARDTDGTVYSLDYKAAMPVNTSPLVNTPTVANNK